jgi:hypothetical protein
MRSAFFIVVLSSLCAFALSIDAKPQFQFAPDDRHATMVNLLPDVEGLNLDDAMLWRDIAVPRTYQEGGHAFHPPNVPGSLNVNRRFPFNVTAGMDDCDQSRVGNVKFMILPKSDRYPRGKPVAVYYPDRFRVSWAYPEGAILGEILWQYDPERRESWAFEVRTRTRKKDEWFPNVYRPVTQERELEQFGDQPTKRTSIHHKGIVDSTGVVKQLPIMSSEKVKQLLSRRFRSIRETRWSEDADGPESVQEFSIIPKGYKSFLKVDTDTCMQCHAKAGADGVRGADGIFDFHPFARDNISRDGKSLPLRFRGDLDAAGVTKHVQGLEGYHLIEGLR